MALLERDDVVDDAAAHETEVAGVRRDLDLGDAGDDPVAERRDDALGQRLALARPALRIDDVVALAPAADELRDQLRRILEVAVDHDDGVAGGGLEPGERGHRLAEASREAQHLHARIALAERQDAAPRCGPSKGRG